MKSRVLAILVGLVLALGLAAEVPPAKVSDLGSSPWSSPVASLTSPRDGVWVLTPDHGPVVELRGPLGPLPTAKVARVDVDPEYHRDGAIFQIRMFDAAGALVVFAGFHLPLPWGDQGPNRLVGLGTDWVEVYANRVTTKVFVGQPQTFGPTPPGWSLRLLAVRRAPGPNEPLVLDDPGDRVALLWVRMN